MSRLSYPHAHFAYFHHLVHFARIHPALSLLLVFMVTMVMIMPAAGRVATANAAAAPGMGFALNAGD